MKRLLGIRLSEKLLERMKKYVMEQKKEHPYTITELVRSAVIRYLERAEKQDYLERKESELLKK